MLCSHLAIATGLDHRHYDVLGRHEGQLLGDVPGYDLGINDQTLGDVLQRHEDDIGREVSLGQGDAPVSRIIQGALHPLIGSRLQAVVDQGHEVPGYAATPLASHRVPLVWHRR